MITTQILNNDWKELGEIEIKKEKPYWLKLRNDNVVLAVYLTTPSSTGWAKAYFNDNNDLVASGNEFYMARGSKIQPAFKS